eukprot:SM000035S13117  [mRNA]  locus=s35:541699:543389:- [translate_table: standard]
MEISNACKHGSIVYHPSLLPRHRGASAINWTLMEGDRRTGLTVFWADDGLDTGPILLQKECDVEPNDTVSSLYKRFLFPEGVKAMGEAVDLIVRGEAPRIAQPEEGASYDPLWKDPKLARVDFAQPAAALHNFIRGNDRALGAWAVINGVMTTLYGSHALLAGEPAADGVQVEMEGSRTPGVVTRQGLVIQAEDGGRLCISTVKVEGVVRPASELVVVEQLQS